jgi:hypothetical protein
VPRATRHPTEESPKAKVVGCLLMPLLFLGMILSRALIAVPIWVWRNCCAPGWARTPLGGLVLLLGLFLILVAWAGIPQLLSRVHIGPEGLRVRLVRIGRTRVERLVPWAAIEMVILDQPRHGPRSRARGHPPSPARLLLVPAAGADLGVPAAHHSPLDGRACVLLFSFNQVRDSPDEVARALARYGASRFVDTRPPRHQRDAPRAGAPTAGVPTAGVPRAGVPRFDHALRGYDCARVDELVQQGHAALRSGDAAERRAARSALEAASLPRATRGYDCSQVDAYLTAISVQLASPGA